MNFVSNALGKAVTKWVNGREYLVAPATTIVHGVLSGSKGALYYPPEETHKAGPAWNKVPVVLYHPMDERGNNVEVDYPGVRARQEIGFTQDTRTNNGDKLQHQVWFDVKKTAQADKRFGTDVLNRLRQGHAPIGTSTGLFTEDVAAQPGANFNGRPYSYVAINHRPDHLAVLPDQVGACSINDGCGILINGKQGKAPMTRRDAIGRRLTLTQNGWMALSSNSNVVTPLIQNQGDDGFVLNMWSDEARAAALAARKAGATANKVSLRSLTVKSQGYTGVKADANAAKAHEDAAKQYKEAIYHHLTSANKAGKAGSAEEVAGYNKLTNAKETHERLAAHHSSITSNLGEQSPMPLTSNQLADRIERLEILFNADANDRDNAGKFAAGGGAGTPLDPNDIDEEDDEEEDEDTPRDILGVPVGKGKSTKNSNPEGINQYTGGGSLGSEHHKGGENYHGEAVAGALSKAGISAKPDSAGATASHGHMAVVKTLMDKGWEHKGVQAADGGKSVHALSKGNNRATVHEEGSKTSGVVITKHPTTNTTQGRHPKEGTYQGMAHTAAREGYADTRQNPLELDHFGSSNGDDAAEPIEDEDSEIGQGDRPGVAKGEDKPIISTDIAEAYLTYNRDWPQAKRDALKESAPEDFAGPHKSFPIKSQTDVDSASKLIGHADNPDAVKGKIKSIAARKGLAVPDAWKQGTNNMSPEMYGGDPHAMSKQAAGATLQTEHEGAMPHAQAAIAASKNDKPERAAALHQKAAGMHEMAATEARKVNQPMEAADHDQAAALHRKAASMQSATCNQRRTPVAFNRAAALQQLTRNCACDKDLVALNSMSDKMLQFMVANEKAEGSNADVVGGEGEEGAGSSEEVQDGGNKIAKGGKVKEKALPGAGTNNRAAEWLNSMPDEFKPVWNSAVEADREKRLALVERITANVGDPKAKADMQKQFMNIQRYDIHQLRQLASLVPQPRMAHNQQAMNPYATEAQPIYLGANGAPATLNQQADMDDVLDIPTLNFAAEKAAEKQSA